MTLPKAMEVTSDGKELIKRWLDAKSLLHRAEAEVSRRIADDKEAKQLLAKWLLPDDAQPGEKIAVWFGDSLIQVTKGYQNYPHEVAVRTRGHKFHELQEK